MNSAGKESGVPLSAIVPKRTRVVLTPVPTPRRFYIVKSKSFLVRMKEALRAIGCDVITNHRENKMIVFNAGTVVPVAQNNPMIVTDTAEKLIVDQHNGAIHVEFVKGPTEEGRWIAGRDWVVAQARTLLLSAANRNCVEAQQAPAGAADVKAEPMEIEAVSAPADGSTQTEASAAPSAEPVITIREVQEELAVWSKKLTAQSNVGGTPGPPVIRPPTPPLANLSPWLLRQRRALLEMIAAQNKLAFWENSIGEFCFALNPASLHSTSSTPPSSQPHLIVSDVYLPGHIAVVTGDYRIPVGSLMMKGDGRELPVWSQLCAVVKAYFNIN